MIGRRHRERPDPHELVAERIRAGLEPFEPLPPEIRRKDNKKLLIWFGLAVVVIALLRNGPGQGAPAVKGSCTRPAFAFDRTSVRYYGTVKWSVAGPSGAQVFITADSPSVDAGKLLGPVTLRSCKASGLFGVPLKNGRHVVRVFLRQPDGSTRVLGTRSLEVHAPH